ncbi:hypothetical protein DFH94DRAFT_403567 [Russula ochroleuca]|jgi:hypothetical protein|uniref:Uncharacterized protein n=1 Tax=Russula ochroleuca TaxID=152965 RepID=A0A9P5MY12_9AGAM|nr:hypothetical protein DFH94DRAFT_403567 [Russula ochroleuca]
MTSQSTLADGLYTISKNQTTLATLQSVQPGTDIVLLPSSAHEAPDQRWEIKRTSKGTYTITNQEISLSYEGEPERRKRIRGYPDDREWSLYKAADPFSYHVVVPGGPIDGQELAFDVSPLRIFPPLTDLNYLNVEDQKQAWVFTREEF